MKDTSGVGGPQQGQGVDKGVPQQPLTGQGTVQVSQADDEIRKYADQLAISIKIMGCGGGGCNTVHRCVNAGITGAQLCALNTDAKHLLSINSPIKILIGKNATRGLGAGAIPRVGEQAAMESQWEIRNVMNGANIVFVTAGMGGGTGTGSAHYVADIAKNQLRALTIGVVTLPFKAEGTVRMENAIAGLKRLSATCDTTIVVLNDKLVQLVPKLPVEAAFKVADEVLMQTIKGITEIVTKPGLVNLDYADIQTIMEEGGMAFVGIGESDSDDDKVTAAVNEALSSPLLGDIDMKDSKGVMIRVTGGPSMTVDEAQKAAAIVGKRISPKARIIWGCSVEPELEDTIKVLLIFTGARSPYLIGRGGQPTLNADTVMKGASPGSVAPKGRDVKEEVDFVS